MTKFKSWSKQNKIEFCTFHQISAICLNLKYVNNKNCHRKLLFEEFSSTIINKRNLQKSTPTIPKI